MAGAGFKTFATGDVLTASDVNTYLMQQTVMVFASSAARSTALGGNVAEGMLSYLKDTKNTEYYNGTSWVVLSTGGDITGVTAGTGISGGGTSGDVTVTNSMATAMTNKGDLVPATGSGTFARLAAGSDGSILVANSAASTGLAYTPYFVAGKNKIINGDFGVWQRGTSGFSTAGNYTADRWYFLLNSGTGTVSQETTTVVPGTVNSLKFTSTSAGWPIFIQAIETANAISLAGQTATLSLYVATSTAVNVDLFVQYSTTVDNAVAGTWTTAFSSSGVTTTSSLVRKTATGAIPSNAKSIRFLIQSSAALANAATLIIGQVQLEAGSVATPFTTATGTIQGELAACQRYYWRETPGGAYSTYGIGNSISTTGAYVYVKFPVQMRAFPSSIDYSNLAFQVGGSSVIALSSLTIDQGGFNTVSLSAVTASTWTANQGGRLLNNNNAAGYLGFSAEL